jgi:LAO/AO transport system kinase
VALVLDAAGKSLVIIETVGVGQDEVDIVRTADISIVVLVPGTGDDVQALKAGIMEIADIFVVNKADRDGATARQSVGDLSLQSSEVGSGGRRSKTEATTCRAWSCRRSRRFAHSEAHAGRLKARTSSACATLIHRH